MRPLITAIVALLLPIGSAQASEIIPGPVVATYVSAYDGDTVTVDAHVWPGLIARTSVRLRGIDTPEIRGKCDAEKEDAITARDFIADRLTHGTIVLLRNIEQDKYGGRVVADLSIDGYSAVVLLLAANLGRPYDGGTRSSWCDAVAAVR